MTVLRRTSPQAPRPGSVPADPTQWSQKSQQSVAFSFTREYRDQPYQCWHCKAACVFTAEDQKYTFEVRKASKDQRRVLCTTCWRESSQIRAHLRACEEQWHQSKNVLKADAQFLARWLRLVQALDKFVPYKADSAKKAMLAKLIAAIAS